MIKKTCPNCGTEYEPELAQEPNFEQDYQRWRGGGGLIQNIWPHATTTQREQLQTGICSDKCWDQYLGTGEE